jgi:hypothetical protein
LTWKPKVIYIRDGRTNKVADKVYEELAGISPATPGLQVFVGNPFHVSFFLLLMMMQSVALFKQPANAFVAQIVNLDR